MIVQIQDLSKSFGGQLVFQEATAQIDGNQRVGLIGANGAGKSTLLKLIYGDLTPDEGTVGRGKGKTYGFLRQHSGLNEKNTIQEEMYSVFSWLLEMEEIMREDETRLTMLDPTSEDYETVSQRYTSMGHQFELGEGYQIDAKIARVLQGMGFGETPRDTPIAVLSGGEKTRLALCKLLLEHPDLLILDEPTNHLDFPTMVWLEEYLEDYSGALLIVSHDRYFLNRLCNRVWEIENHRLSTYKGNYSSYLVQKEERMVLHQKQYESQQEEIAKLEDFIARNLVRASTTGRAQARQKILDKMVRVPKPIPPPKPPHLRFTVRREPVNDVLVVEDLSLRIGEPPKELFSGMDLHVFRGEKIAIVGRNGIGKSSMLKALLGKLPPDSGRILWGRNTDISYFEQEDGALDKNKTVLQEFWDTFPREDRFSIRSILGQAGLSGEEVEKKVGDLSGGERARLKFAKIMMEQGNVILLDEPTNHLDLPTNEVLDTALEEYEGTLLVISHDRYLLNKFPDKIVELEEDGIHIYPGKYDDYAEKKEKERQAKKEQEEEHQQEQSSSSRNYRTREDRQRGAFRRKRLKELEQSIFQLEEERDQLQLEIGKPEIVVDFQELEPRYLRLEEIRVDLEEQMEEWLLLGAEEEEEG